MLNLTRLSKFSSSAKLQFGQSVRKKTLCNKFLHTDSSSLKRKSIVGKYVLGSLIFGFSTIVVYAKYDNKFRLWLKNNVYGSDDLLKLLFFENKSVSEQSNNIKSQLIPQTNNVVNVSKSTALQFGSKEHTKVVEKSDKLLNQKLSDEQNISGKITEKQPSNLRQIENEITLIFEEVSDSYSKALEALKNYYDILNETMNAGSHKLSSSSLTKLKKMNIEKDELFETATKIMQTSLEHLDKLLYSFNDSKTEVTSEVKEMIKNHIFKSKKDIKTLGNDFEIEKKKLLLYNKYNDKVINIRKQFSDELQTLFPHVRLEDEDLKLTNAEFNMFVEYITQKLLFYQNELFKQETIGEIRVNNTVNALKNDNVNAIDKVLEFQVEKQRRNHLYNFIKESFGSKANGEAKFKQSLKFQTEVHIDHLKEAAELAKNEVDRRVNLEYSEKAELEKLQYQEQVSSMVAVMHAINDVLKEHSEKRNKLNESVSLWIACQSLFEAITTNYVVSKHELKPLQKLVDDIKKAGENHNVIKELLNTIPERVLSRGVYTEETLKDRFFSIEDKAFHMALVPDTNVTLFDLVTSFVFTIFTFKPSESIPKEELNNAPINVNELNNIDVLQRARYWVERDNYYQALKYMNLLKGGAKVIASDWINETHEYLATQQIAQTLLSYASASLRSHVGHTTKHLNN